MSKTVQIRDIDDEVYAQVARRAAEQGMSVPEFLKREVARLAARPTVAEWLERTRRRTAPISRGDIVATLDESRGDWPA